MTKKKVVFYYDGNQGLQMNGEGLLPESVERMDNFLVDLNDEICSRPEFVDYAGEYSFYINYDLTLLVDSSNTDLVYALNDYIRNKYEIVFEKRMVI